MSLTALYQRIDLAVSELEHTYGVLILGVDDSDFDTEDRYAAIYEVERKIAALLDLKKIHRLYRIGDDEVGEVVERFVDGRPVVVGKKKRHRAAFGEDIYSIASHYKVAWQDIAHLNDIEPDDVIAGSVITIPHTYSDNRRVYERVGVFDSHEGIRALGKDIDCMITFEGDDLKTVAGYDCLNQGVRAIINTPLGSHPVIKSFGVRQDVGGELPEDAYAFQKAISIREGLLQDGRIVDVVSTLLDSADPEGFEIRSEVVSILYNEENRL